MKPNIDMTKDMMDFATNDFMDDQERMDKKRIFQMVYSNDIMTASVAFLHFETEVVHHVLTDMNAVGVSWCGLRITRKNQPEWLNADYLAVTCMACLAEMT